MNRSGNLFITCLCIPYRRTHPKFNKRDNAPGTKSSPGRVPVTEINVYEENTEERQSKVYSG